MSRIRFGLGLLCIAHIHAFKWDCLNCVIETDYILYYLIVPNALKNMSSLFYTASRNNVDCVFSFCAAAILYWSNFVNTVSFS